jgi:hypothetical protein
MAVGKAGLIPLHEGTRRMQARTVVRAEQNQCIASFAVLLLEILRVLACAGLLF